MTEEEIKKRDIKINLLIRAAEKEERKKKKIWKKHKPGQQLIKNAVNNITNIYARDKASRI